MDDPVKCMFLWRPGEAAPLETFAAQARQTLTGRLRGRSVTEVVLHVTSRPPPRLSLLPWRREPLALLSVRASALEPVLDALRGLPGRLDGYRVHEAIPLARARTWPAGTRAPGACLLTLFRQNPKLERAEFFREWFGVHTPMSLRIHPLWGYTRNAVHSALVADSAPWDGLVTEDFRTDADLFDLHRLFGGALKAIPNMARVGAHISKFLELSTLQNFLVEEYLLQPDAT